MTHEDVFLQDILEHREDDTPRRIFADWLLDRDDPVQVARGEFIHVQCDIARQPPEAGRPLHLVSRERELLEAHGREWGSLFQRLGCCCWEYRRGFVEGIGVPASAFLAHTAALFRAAPIRELKLYGAGSVIHDLAASPYLARVQILDLEKNELGDDEIQTLAASPHLHALRTLLLWSNRISDAGLAALVGARVTNLVRLDLSSNTIADEGAAALARAALLGRLLLLDLTGNQITDVGAQALAASPYADGLGWLDLTKNPIGPVGQSALRERFPGRVQVWG
jgi:uncharacterized protein (TIGR02996 family)